MMLWIQPATTLALTIQKFENGRYVSFDGDLQVRIGNADILGQHAGGPHIILTGLAQENTGPFIFFY